MTSLENKEGKTIRWYNNLEQCLNDVKNWMIDNKLKFNDDKTEVMLINPKCYAIEQDHIKIGNEKIFFSENAKNLGFNLDHNLSIDFHVKNLSKVIYLEIRNCSPIPQLLVYFQLKQL